MGWCHGICRCEVTKSDWRNGEKRGTLHGMNNSKKRLALFKISDAKCHCKKVYLLYKMPTFAVCKSHFNNSYRCSINSTFILILQIYRNSLSGLFISKAERAWEFYILSKSLACVKNIGKFISTWPAVKKLSLK